ncbi:inorganic phosphate transporter [Candidatus Acetothermia bacterium]|nr:MAG: inorganic phosphate transporter [Candidatus Acetothermia bacterium]
MVELAFLFLAGAYVGWNIGANDAANCIGTSVGSGLLSFRRAIIIVSIFAVIGGVTQGGNVMHTMGKGIVTSEIPHLGILVGMLSAGIFVTLASSLRLPVSTSEAIVGGIMGIGLAIGADINLTTLAHIGEVWVICPILTGLIASLLYLGTRALLRRVGHESFWQRVPKILLLFSASYISFSLGANHVGTAMGPLSNIGISSRFLSLLGGLSLAAGALTFGSRVTKAVGREITTLDHISAFSAQTAAALSVHFFSIVGIPVSTTQSVVGAVAAVGFLNGLQTVRKRKLIEIAVGWVATPTSAGIFSFLLYKLISLAL